MTGLEPLIIGALVGGGGAAAAGAGALTIAAVAGLGASAGGAFDASRSQYRLDKAVIEANREQAKLSAAEKALSNARNFRRSLASQMALANFRGGPGSSIASQFGADSMANFLQDQQAIGRGAQQIDTAASIAKANASLGRDARTIGTIGTLGKSFFDSTNFSSSTPKKG